MAHLDLTRIDEQLSDLTKTDQERYDRWIADHGHERRQYRRAVFYCCPDILTDMGSGQFEVIARPLPRDAKRIATFYNEAKDQIGIVIESDEFEPIYEGDLMPILQPMIFKKIHPGENILRRACSFIWDAAERHHVDLGFLAPYVLGGSIGRMPKRKIGKVS